MIISRKHWELTSLFLCLYNIHEASDSLLKNVALSVLVFSFSVTLSHLLLTNHEVVLSTIPEENKLASPQHLTYTKLPSSLKKSKMKGSVKFIQPNPAQTEHDIEREDDLDEEVRVIHEEGSLFMSPLASTEPILSHNYAPAEIDVDETSSSATSLGSSKNVPLNVSKKYVRTRSVPALNIETPLRKVVKDLEAVKMMMLSSSFSSEIRNKVEKTLDESILFLKRNESAGVSQKMHKTLSLSGGDLTWCNYLLSDHAPYSESEASSKLKRHQSKLFSSKSFRFPKKQDSLVSRIEDESSVDWFIDTNNLRIAIDDPVLNTSIDLVPLSMSRARNLRSHSVDWVFNEANNRRSRALSDSAPSPQRFIWLPALTVGKYLDNWDLDVFALSVETQHRPLTWLLFFIFKQRDWFKTFKISETTLENFCSEVEAGYNRDIPYHNNLHAADVVNSAYYLLVCSEFAKSMPEIVIFSGVIAAAVHDLKHPGRTARFLIHNRDPLSIRYNDFSVLEQMHLSETFEILNKESCDITFNFSEEEYLLFRKLVIHSVLSTDLKHHLDTIVKVKQFSASLFTDLQSVENQERVLELSVKLADVGHAGKNPRLHKQWSRRIQEEFYLQGDAERDLGLKISPHMDRTCPDIAQNQISFFKFIATPLFQCVSEVENVHSNFQSIYSQVLENERIWHYC